MKMEEIQKQFNIDKLSAKILESKELNEEEIKDLILPHDLHSLESELLIQQVVNRIKIAKQNREKILVCGDYDCDGICATTILFDALKKLGLEVGFYIPNRLLEGYGLHPKTVKLAKEKGYSILITVDNGVKAFEALLLAKEENIEVIVSDHHHYEEEIPTSLFVHQTLLSPSFQTLCGAGIALELSRALLGYDEPYHVVLACIASIGDVMNVTLETRTIIKHGLHYLNSHRFPTIEALHPVGGVWDEERIAFQIVPKLNATGRLSDLVNVNNTVHYLLLDNSSEIDKVAKQILDINTKRKLLSEEIVRDIELHLNQKNGFYYVYGKSYHEGIVGLAAGSLASSLDAPVMVLNESDNIYRGSIRSADKADLTTFFNGVKDLFSAFGGHRAAAGLSISKENIQTLLNYIETNYIPLQFEESKEMLLNLDKEDRDITKIETMFQTCKPFGSGFEKPKFYIPSVNIIKKQELSSGKHWKLIDDEQNEYLLFSISEEDKKKLESNKVSFVAEVTISTFRNIKKINFLVQEVIVK